MKEQAVKLFVDAHVFDKEYQGTRTFIKEIYSIIAQKPDILLYLGAYNIDNLKKHFPEQSNIIFIKYKSASGLLRLAYHIPLIIRKHKIQYAHFQYIVPPIKNCRYINTVHDILFYEYPKEFSFFYRLTKSWLFRISALRSDILTTVSEHSKQSIKKYFKIKDSEITITPNGVAPYFFEQYDKQYSTDYVKKKYGVEKYILFVSRLEPRKNHLFLLNAYLRLRLYAKGFHLVLLGHKSISIPQFEKTIDDLPADVKKFIFFNDSVGDADLLEFYRGAFLFVYTSKAEGFGIPPLEAGALKIPVICSNTSAMSDFSFFNRTQIDPYDFEPFVNMLDNIVSHPPDNAYLDKISATIQQRYSWKRSAEILYESIISNKNSNPPQR